MLAVRPLVAAASLGLFAACQNMPEPIPPPSPQVTVPPIPAPPVASGRLPFDPVAVGLTADGQQRLCDEHLAAAEKHLAEIRALAGAPAQQLTYEATVGRFDDATAELLNAQQFPYLMALAHPDPAVRAAAKLCDPKVDKIKTGLYLDATVAGVIKAYAARGEKTEGERARLLTETLRDFRRNGLDLPPDKQALLRGYNATLTEIGQQFAANIGASTATLSILPSQLAGLPAEYVQKHPTKDGKVVITTDYPDYFPFVTYAKDRRAALDLYTLFTNRGGEQNLKLLDQLLETRSDKAKLLGYATWADYAIEPRMAKTPRAVREFLGQVKAAVKAPADAELALIMQEHVALGGKATDRLPPPDRYYLEDRVREKKFKFSSQELSGYFETGAVLNGLLDVTKAMYGLEYTKVNEPTWHPDVSVYEVRAVSAGGDPKPPGKLLGKVYLDLYSRPDKFKHAAMFAVRTAKRFSDGTTQLPVAALECNFPRPSDPGSSGPPALMTHDEVSTFFHEFGHVLHHILTRSELATYSGSNTVGDFVEAPSQMFEEWTWSREVLDRFARHHQTGAKIPDELFAAMHKSRAFGRALSTERQLFLAYLDLEYHSRDPGFDTTRVVEEVQKATDAFAYVKGTHFQSSFGHLIDYDAGYYGYQWALALSRDVLSRFKKEGLMNPSTAASWRDEVLAKGGGIDERTLITRFLGREPNNEAYIAFLQGKEP
jgi:thimet oligopeptidase